MICRHVRFEPVGRPELEWVPMALREATCCLRASDPRRCNAELRSLGVAVSDEDTRCPQNLESSWRRCPLCRPRAAGTRWAGDAPRNEFGVPLVF